MAFAIGASILYRNWKYEQELDSLLWKVDFRDIEIKETSNNNATENKTAPVRSNFFRLSINTETSQIFSGNVPIYQDKSGIFKF